MPEDIKKEIVELLEDLTYWDTCPQTYKDRIPVMVEALKQGQILDIDSFCDCEEGFFKVEARECSECGELAREDLF